MAMARSVNGIWLALVVCVSAAAQPQQSLPGGIQTIELGQANGQILSFRQASGATDVELRGTPLQPGAYTRAKIQSRQGFIEIEIGSREIKLLPPATRFGRDYLTYVLWAVAPDGEPANLGEIIFDDRGNREVKVTTGLQAFWLMVTAEPDFAVIDPSPQMVLYSITQANSDAPNRALAVPGKLAYHTYYTSYDGTPAGAASNLPGELLQARKAIELAGKTGVLAQAAPAGQPLPDEETARRLLELARQYLQLADNQLRQGGRIEDVAQFARTATQAAEGARALASGATGSLRAQLLARQVERAQQEAAQAQQVASERQQEITTLQRRVQTMERAGETTSHEVQRLRDQLASLERAFQQSVGDLEAGRKRLREDREKVCGELQRQLARLGQLTDQGGSMALTLASDILFDSGSADLRPPARESLAKLATIRLLLFPNARVRYEGHTDRVGDDDYNQWLSEQRALAVYRYFLEEALAAAASSEEQQSAQHLIGVVQELQKMSFAQARRRRPQRQQLLDQLGDSVVGMGERMPVEDTPGASERNRRVVLVFPPAQMGQASSICQPGTSEP